jgi:hypothetical protein
VLWLIGDLRALVLRPIRIEGGALLLRLGLGVLGSSNLVLKLRRPFELHGPFGIRKTSDTLLLRVDDPRPSRRRLANERSATGEAVAGPG